jgi:medium-chain acyl-[acyl-carrier-protein] hydrolase
MGGLVAYAMAKRLQREQLKAPAALIVSGCPPPDFLDEPKYKLAAFDDESVLNYFSNLNYESVIALRANPGLYKFLVPILKADAQLIDSWSDRSIESIDTKIVAFNGTQDPFCTQANMRRWEHLAALGFSQYEIEGNHLFIDTNADAMCKILTMELDLLSPLKRHAP